MGFRVLGSGIWVLGLGFRNQVMSYIPCHILRLLDIPGAGYLGAPSSNLGWLFSGTL